MKVKVRSDEEEITKELKNAWRDLTTKEMEVPSKNPHG
jgi:hypothetical protein